MCCVFFSGRQKQGEDRKVVLLRQGKKVSERDRKPRVYMQVFIIRHSIFRGVAWGFGDVGKHIILPKRLLFLYSKADEGSGGQLG